MFCGSSSQCRGFAGSKSFDCPNIGYIEIIGIHVLILVYVCRSDTDLNTTSNRWVGKEGRAILWHRPLGNQV